MKQMRVSSGLNLHHHSKDHMSDYIKAGILFHKESGFDAIDFGIGLLDLSNDAWLPRAEQAVSDAKEAGIRFELCHLPFIGGGGMKSEEAMRQFDERMHRAIDAAVVIGADYAVLHPTTATMPMKAFDRTEQYDQVMKHLSPYAEHAAKVGLNIVVENMRVHPGAVLTHRYCQTPEELCEIADALGIGVCWDFGHANISGIKQSEGLAYVGKRLKVLHINDNVGMDDEHIPPFTGNVDWRDAMHGLALIDFDGLLNFEISTGKLPASVRKAFAAYLMDSAKELMTYIE